jgi:thiamine biosynthesis lipoprotein
MTIRFRWFLPIAVAGTVACTAPPAVERLSGPTMGTTYEVVVIRHPQGPARGQIEALVERVLDDVNRHLSAYDPDSELARLNADPRTGWVEVSPTLLDAVVQSQAVSRATGGAFDITVAPLVQAWGFGAGAAAGDARPDTTQLAALRAGTGWHRIGTRSTPPAILRAQAHLTLDVDGIAPGIAVDRMADGLESLGVRDYLVEIGGEVRARGRSPAGRVWRVAVEAPVAGERRAQAIIELDGLAVSTSGDYRSFRMSGGRRVSHVIDPRTGAPVAHRLTSVSVVHRSAAQADALSTALMVLGPQEGLALARRLGLAALFIERRAGSGPFIETQTDAFAALRRPLP